MLEAVAPLVEGEPPDDAGEASPSSSPGSLLLATLLEAETPLLERVSPDGTSDSLVDSALSFPSPLAVVRYHHLNHLEKTVPGYQSSTVPCQFLPKTMALSLLQPRTFQAS